MGRHAYSDRDAQLVGQGNRAQHCGAVDAKAKEGVRIEGEVDAADIVVVVHVRAMVPRHVVISDGRLDRRRARDLSERVDLEMIAHLVREVRRTAPPSPVPRQVTDESAPYVLRPHFDQPEKPPLARTSDPFRTAAGTEQQKAMVAAISSAWSNLRDSWVLANSLVSGKP